MPHRTARLAALAAGLAALATSGAALPASAQPKKQTVSDATCKQWKGWYDDDTKAAADARKAGNERLAQSYDRQAAYDKKLATDANCPWAAAAARRAPSRVVTTTAAFTVGPGR